MFFPTDVLNCKRNMLFFTNEVWKEKTIKISSIGSVELRVSGILFLSESVIL